MVNRAIGLQAIPPGAGEGGEEEGRGQFDRISGTEGGRGRKWRECELNTSQSRVGTGGRIIFPSDISSTLVHSK